MENNKQKTPYELFDVECGNGWSELLKPIFDYIENYNKDKDDKNKIEVCQVKQKFGSLRFYTSFSTDELDELIEKAENESAHTCELCGSKENIGYTCGWITTCCEKCVKEMAKRCKKTFNWRPLNIEKGYKWIEVNSDGTQKPIKIQSN